MKNQNHGISEPHPRQQQEFNEMQLWKQQLMYKHLQEIQRQRQLQQLDLGEKQNLLSQLSNGAKQVGSEQSLPVLHGMPVNNASNSMWSGELKGGDSKATNNSFMFFGGNVNWTQQGGPSVRSFSNGLMFSHDQGQKIRPMGFAPHGADQYFYETPLSGSKYSSSHQYPQSQGKSHAWTDAMNNAGENSGEKPFMLQTALNYHQNNQFVVPESGSIRHDVSDVKLGLPGKSLFGSAPLQGLQSGAVTGNFPHGDYFKHTVQVQEIQDAQQGKWSGKPQVNKLLEVGSSVVESNRDRTEEKLLFGTDKDKFNGPFEESDNKEKGYHRYANPFRNSGNVSAFPSIQSGSWSALMLDALEASSSDTGIQEESSGLSLRKAESSTGNLFGKQQVSWDDTNLQSSSCSTSRPLPLFNDTSGSPNCLSYQQSTELPYKKNEKVAVDVSHESSQQSSQETNHQQLDQRTNHFVVNNLHEHAPSISVFNGVWPEQISGLSASTLYSAGMEFDMQNMKVWDQRQNVLPHNGSSMSANKLKGWNGIQSLDPRGNNSFGARSNDDAQRTMPLENDHDENMWRVGGNQLAASFPTSDDGQESEVVSNRIHGEDSYAVNITAVTGSNSTKLDRGLKQQAAHQNQLNFGEQVAIGFSTNYEGGESLAHYHNQQNRHSQATDKNKEPNENFDHVRENSYMRSARNDGYIPDKSDPSHFTESRYSAMKSHLVSGNGPRPLVYSTQHLSGQSGQNPFGSHMFQHHPMVHMKNNVEHVGQNNQPQQYSRPSCQSIVQGLENPECEHARGSQSTGQTLSHPAVSFGKEHFTVSQKDVKVVNEQSRGTTNPHASLLTSFSGSATHIPHKQMTDQRSPNMLELLDKVDQARKSSTVFSFSDLSVVSEIPEAAVSDEFACLHHGHSSALQGFGLELAPPSQRQSGFDHNAPSEASFQTDGQTNRSSDRAVSHQYAQTSPFMSSKVSPFRFNPSVDSAASQLQSSSPGSSQQINASPNQLCLNQQFPIVETMSTEKSSATPAMSRKGSFTNMLNNVWTKLSAQQRASLVQARKMIPRPPESMKSLPTSTNTNSWVSQKAVDQGNVSENPPPEFGTCSTNLQIVYGEENLEEGNSLERIPLTRVADASKTNDLSQGQEPVFKHSSDENSRVSISSSFHCVQQDLSKGKTALSLSLDSQKEHPSMPNLKQNYSLLQQVQSMKGVDSDPSKRAIKRPKGADFRFGTPEVDRAIGEGFVYGHNTSVRDLDATIHDSSLPSDVKMLRFSRQSKDESVVTSSQGMDRETTSGVLIPSREQNLQSLGKLSTLTFCREEHPNINSQVAVSCFEQYGINKNGQIVGRNDENDNSYSTSKTISQHHSFTKDSESKGSGILVEQRNNTTQVGCVKESTPSIPLSSAECSSSLHCLPSNGIYNRMTLIPKKRKTATSELLPWHREVMEGSKRLHVASNAELSWALVTNRLIEKPEHENKMIEAPRSINRPRNRLILTTQLMQQVLPSIPAAILSADATASYESMTYFVSKLVLEDAFSLISFRTSNSCFLSDTGNKIFENLKASKEDRDHVIIETMEGFTGKSRKLESDLSRLQKTSILNVRLECHELDTISIINRFAKFHDRSQMNRVVGASTSVCAPRRISPQRHVNIQAVTGNLPEGVHCLSL